MTKVMFVCHGNICRSPMAEFVFRDMIKELGLSHEFKIASSATSTEEIGNPVHRGTRKKLSEHGIDCTGKTSRRFTKADYDEYDYILCMDDNNMRNIKRIVPNDDKHKISKLLERNIADPWYTDNFDITYNDIKEGLSMLLDTILQKL